MPIIANDQAAEIPWRPGYRRFTLAGQEQGVACSASYSVLEPGAGAPLHRHDDLDEVLIVVEGKLDMRIGDERHLVGADQTISIPAGGRTPLSRSDPRRRASMRFRRSRAL